MHLLATSTLAWIGFCIFILAMLAIDLGVFNRRPHEITFKNAAVWSVVWITLALIFAALLFHPLGLELFGPARHQKGLEFLTGYLIELALSIDNLFIFLLIFSYFKVPPKYQHRVLYWGVLGALVMRITMIFLGTELIQHFHWVIYLFGAFLVYTAVRMFRAEEVSIEPDENVIVQSPIWSSQLIRSRRSLASRRIVSSYTPQTSSRFWACALSISCWPASSKDFTTLSLAWA